MTLSDICLCYRCGSYIEGEPSEYDDFPSLRESCQDYYENYICVGERSVYSDRSFLFL